MANKMERFTQRARRVMSLAQEEAERLQHGALDTQHLLFGLTFESGGVAGRVLQETGINREIVRDMVSRMAPTNTYHSGEPPILSEGTKRALELGVDEARRMGHHYIGTEHLLLGLVRLSEGGAIEILKRNGISPEEIRRQTRRVLQESPLRPKPPDEGTPIPSPVPGTILSDYSIRVTVRNTMTNEEELAFNIRLDRVQIELANAIRRVFQGKAVDPIEWSSGGNQIEVTVKKTED
jgi:ATP-dependent Clp protease ATP-binding subunit ClpA